MIRQYEMMFILELGEEQETLEKLKSLLTQEGKILKENEMGIRTLAYPIQKREKGYYHVFEMEMPASKIRDIEEEIRLNERILRWMKLSLDYRKKKRSKRKTPRVKKPPISAEPAIERPSEETRVEETRVKEIRVEETKVEETKINETKAIEDPTEITEEQSQEQKKND